MRCVARTRSSLRRVMHGLDALSRREALLAFVAVALLAPLYFPTLVPHAVRRTCAITLVVASLIFGLVYLRRLAGRFE